MLTFNDVLRAGSLDPASVRLVRHKPDTMRHRTIFDAAMRGDEEFGRYQETQGTAQVISQFRAAKQLASFVVDPTTKQTLFAGVWDQLGEREPTDEAFGSTPSIQNAVFRTQVRLDFDDYRGRLVVEWGDGERAWVQRADSRDKPIVEIKKRREDPRFPGFMNLRHQLDQIETIPVSWSEVLRNARGVYLLVHRKRGDQYVGSAYGVGGFMARWTTYADGHGGNVAMKAVGSPAEEYDVAVLEVVGSEATDEDIFKCETRWKVKLGTRVTGLNRN